LSTITFDSEKSEEIIRYFLKERAGWTDEELDDSLSNEEWMATECPKVVAIINEALDRARKKSDEQFRKYREWYNYYLDRIKEWLAYRLNLIWNAMDDPNDWRSEVEFAVAISDACDAVELLRKTLEDEIVGKE
jgi:hypothetical protein